MRGTNVIGLMLAIFLCLAVCVNGVLQEMDRSDKASRYTEIEATVIGFSTNRDERHYTNGRYYRPFIIVYNSDLEYKVDGKPYYHTLLHSKNTAPTIGTKETLYINPNDPNEVMDSGALWKEIGTFAFAGVGVVWAIFQIYMGTKHKNASANLRSGYFIMMIGLLATLSVIPLFCIFGLSDLIAALILVGLIVMGWGIKDVNAQKSKGFYSEYEFRR